MTDNIKTITYEVKALVVEEILLVRYRTRGSRWRPFGSAPRELRELADSGKIVINKFRRCRSGKFFCGEVTVSSTVTRMGYYLRRRRKGWD
jgi:hypothetical protein